MSVGSLVTRPVSVAQLNAAITAAGGGTGGIAGGGVVGVSARASRCRPRLIEPVSVLSWDAASRAGSDRPVLPMWWCGSGAAAGGEGVVGSVYAATHAGVGGAAVLVGGGFAGGRLVVLHPWGGGIGR